MTKATSTACEALLPDTRSGRPPSRSTSAGYPARRRAFCPLCGREQTDKLASEVATPDAALCAGRCAVAWRALVALRLCESASEDVAARRRSEWEARQPHASTLSELLLRRWRDGDWTVAPEDLLGQL
jgi:hypothetical protein